MSWMSLLGVPGVMKALDKMSDDMSGKIENAVIAAAHLVMNDAKQRAPYKTGNLHGSIHIGGTGIGLSGTDGTDIGGKEVTKDRAKVDVGTNVVYAHNQEFGTTVPAHPYLRPAFDENVEKIQEEVRKALKLL